MKRNEKQCSAQHRAQMNYYGKERIEVLNYDRKELLNSTLWEDMKKICKKFIEFSLELQLFFSEGSIKDLNLKDKKEILFSLNFLKIFKKSNNFFSA